MNQIFFPDNILPQVANNETILIKLIKMFIDSYEESLLELEKSLECGDFDTFQKQAHHMKPTILILFPKSNHETIKYLEAKSSPLSNEETHLEFKNLKSDVNLFVEEALNFLSKK